MTSIILISIYLISAVYNYRWIRLAYFHKEGRWKGTTPTEDNFNCVILPIVNTVMMIYYLKYSWRNANSLYKKESWIVKFFKIGME